ncbi:MAG: hypothetical protein Kow0069_24450 [Promethearchaeota archaeon]
MRSALVDQFRSLPAGPGVSRDPGEAERVLKFVSRCASYWREFGAEKLELDFWGHLTSGERRRFLELVWTALGRLKGFAVPVVVDFLSDLARISSDDAESFSTALFLLSRVISSGNAAHALRAVSKLPSLWAAAPDAARGDLWELVRASMERGEDVVAEETAFELHGSRSAFGEADWREFLEMLADGLNAGSSWRLAALKVVLSLLERGTGCEGAGETGEAAEPKSGEAGAVDWRQVVDSSRKFLERLAAAVEKVPQGGLEGAYALLVQERLLDQLDEKQRARFLKRVRATLGRLPDAEGAADAFLVVERLWSRLDARTRAKFAKEVLRDVARLYRSREDLRLDERSALERLIDVWWDEFSSDPDKVDLFYEEKR